MVVRQLCHRRHDAADRRREAVRSARPPCRPEGARRRRRQRQWQARRGAALVRRRPRPTTCRALLERGRARAAADGWRSRFREADAEALPFRRRAVSTRWSPPSASCSRRTRTGRPPSCMRVCKPGGKIGLANWTPDGFIGQVFKTLGKYLPPPAGAKSPALWGTGARITEMFGARPPRSSSSSATSSSATARAALPRRVQDLLRPGAEGVRRARARGRRSCATICLR